jgi:hypothetical protein
MTLRYYIQQILKQTEEPKAIQATFVPYPYVIQCFTATFIVGLEQLLLHCQQSLEIFMSTCFFGHYTVRHCMTSSCALHCTDLKLTAFSASCPFPHTIVQHHFSAKSDTKSELKIVLCLPLNSGFMSTVIL